MAEAKRRRYIIKRAFQIKYTGIILFFIILTAVISCAAIYFAIFPYLSEKLANVYPQGRLSEVIRNANYKIMISAAFLFPLAVWFGTALSHRIAGPWYRIENILRDTIGGNLASEIKLRKGDELQSLAEVINDVTRDLRARSQKSIGYMESLDETLKLFEEELDKQPLDLMKTKLLILKMQDTSAGLKGTIKK